MPAYVVFTRENTIDAQEMESYTKLAKPTLSQHPGTPLAFYGRLDVLEGPDFEGAVVLEFPSMDEARAWYDSPEYQAAVKHRQAGANYRVFIVEGTPRG
jgi:uncharacterized protein (DUF1330 family)